MADATAAISGEFGELGASLINKLVSGTVVIVGIILFCGLMIALALYVRHLLKFNVPTTLFSPRSVGKPELGYKIIKDSGGFIEDRKTKKRWFRLLKEKVDMPPPPLDYFIMDSKGKNHLFVKQFADDDYRPVRIEFLEDNLPVQFRPDPAVTLWAQLKKQENKKMFDTEGLFMKILPFAGLMVMFMAMIFMTYFITDHWGEFATAAQALKEAAVALKDATVAQTTLG